MFRKFFVAAFAFAAAFGAAAAVDRFGSLPAYDHLADVGKVASITSTGSVGWQYASAASGAVEAPTSSTANDLIAWGDTGGHTLIDSGIPEANVVLVSRQVIAGTGITITPQSQLTSDITVQTLYSATATGACVGNDARLAPTIDTGSGMIFNCGLSAATGGSNTLVVTLTQADGASSPTASPGSCVAYSRSATSKSGSYSVMSAVASTGITIASGATLGLPSGAQYVWVYALNESGVMSVGVAGQPLDPGSTHAVVKMTGSSTSLSTLYGVTGTASNVGVQLIGRVNVNNVTPGVWAVAPSEVAIQPFFGTSDEIIGSTTGVSAGTGIPGEYLSAYGATGPTFANNTVTAVNSLALTPGDWDVTVICGFSASGTVTGTQLVCGAGTSSSALPSQGASQYMQTDAVPTASVGVDIAVPSIRFLITTPTTVYQVVRVLQTSGSWSAYGRMSARRMH